MAVGALKPGEGLRGNPFFLVINETVFLANPGVDCHLTRLKIETQIENTRTMFLELGTVGAETCLATVG